MNQPLRVLALALLSFGCGERGVSLGAEEPCMLDQRLATLLPPAADAELASCARIGQNQLVNPSFEAPAVSSCAASDMVDFCQFPAGQVGGWRTTSEKNQIEIWLDQYKGVPAPDGSQFVELDASSQDTLFQDLALPPGQLMYWSLEHRGRSGLETMELLIGPTEGPASQRTITGGPETWTASSGLYRVGESETVTRFALVSRSGVAEGNLVDSTVFAPVE